MKEITVNSCSRARTRGFTAVEFAAALSIVGLMGVVVIPNALSLIEAAERLEAARTVEHLSAAIHSYHRDTGELPTNLKQLVVDPGAARWNGPYVERYQLTDPWGQTYRYRLPGEHGQFDLYTFGADNLPGGDDSAADIMNRN